jgi:RNA polymerase sigma-70 factor, ECF subfamily
LSVEARYLEPELPDELDDAYAQTFDRLRRMFRARGCSAEEAADLAQEAAIRAFTHIRRWGVNGAGLDPLLNRIARNLLIDRYRRVTPHLVSLDSADDIHDPTQDPSEEVARRQRRTAVQSAIRSLPARHQKAIVYSLSGLSPEEVGRQMGIGRNAADALLHRARRSLREHLAPVREGMWGIGVAVRLRWDRFTRRVGLNDQLADASFAGVANSAMSVAAAAIVAVLAVAGPGAGATPSIARSGSSSRIDRTASISRQISSGGSSGSTGAGSSGIGADDQRSILLGAAKRSSNSSGSTTTITAPSGNDGKPLARVQDRAYGRSAPDPADPVGSTLGTVVEKICTASPATCAGW